MASPIPDRLDRLRALMREEGVVAYLVPSTDPHQSEYVPSCWQRRAWISGFTGSAGDVVVTLETAGLWTDSRYFLQADEQLEGSGITLFRMGRPGVPKVEAWLSEALDDGDSLGVDPRVVSVKQAEDLEKEMSERGISVQYLDRNLIDACWADRPAPSDAAITLLEERDAGEPVAAKLERLRASMKEAGTDAHVVTAVDAIAWLFNLRGSDVDYNPVFLSYAAVTESDAWLFVESDRMTAEAAGSLEGLVEVRPYAEVETFLKDAEAGKTVWIDDSATSRWVGNLVGDRGKRAGRSPIAEFKAVKNTVELSGIRKAHLIDGVAVVRFLKWLEETVGRSPVSERSAADRLLAFRQMGEGFVGPSFPTISGYGAHGAIVHYSVTEASDIPIGQDSLYLVDSGGQYRFGTTDITRTLCFGYPTDEQREMFTRVLRGHIDLATLAFPVGATGRHVDIIARRPLWDAGRNYLHGTGHGIGHYLNVHEGPVSISTRSPDVELAEGHVISNEPGYYKDGEYGIRTENLVTVIADPERSTDTEPFLKFETLTRCPIDTRMVVPEVLGDGGVAWLNAFHQTVRDDLSPHLTAEEAAWLALRTEPI